MQANFSQTHENCAKALYRQRMAMLKEQWVSHSSLQQLEERLRLHLYGIRHFDPAPESEPEDGASAFVYLSCGLLSETPRANQAAWQFATQWLAEGSPRSEAARDAIVLFPLPKLERGIQRLYEEEPGVRPILIYIWNALDLPVPKGLLNQAEIQVQTPDLQVEVMRYLAVREDTGSDVFHHYYSKLTKDPRARSENPEVLEYAIWGGLVRGDPDAARALRRAIEAQQDEQLRSRLLRLLALSGDSESYAVLQQALSKKSAFAYYLLGLSGLPQARDDVLVGLEDPRTADHAEHAWLWMTGQELSRKPRLSVVGEQETDVTTEKDDSLPNVDDAHNWITQHSGLWTESVRMIHGKPMNPLWLLHLAKTWCGQNGQDYVDLLAINMTQPLAVAEQRWAVQRQLKLNQLDPVLTVQTNPSDSNRIAKKTHA